MIITAGVQRVFANLEEDIPLLESGPGRTGVRHDAGHHDPAFLVAQLEVRAQLVVERGRKLNTKTREASVFAVGRIIEKRLDDRKWKNGRNLIVAVVTQ